MADPSSPHPRAPGGGAPHHDRILLVDYGSQFTQLIARRIREAGVYCEIHPPTRDIDWVRAWSPRGVVLSGGPSSVYGDGGPGLDPGLFDLGVPVLGICYGMQLIAAHEGGTVVPGKREYGRATLQLSPGGETSAGEAPGGAPGGGLFHGFDTGDDITVWCSHGDHVDEPPPGFVTLAATADLPVPHYSTARSPRHLPVRMTAVPTGQSLVSCAQPFDRLGQVGYALPYPFDRFLRPHCLLSRRSAPPKSNVDATCYYRLDTI